MMGITQNIVNDPASPAFFPYFQGLHFGALHLKQDEATGMLAIIAIHNTTLGPALGGCRFLPYDSLEQAIIDALRLAHGMSYKAAISQVAFGGGKSVMLKPKQPFDRTKLFHRFAEFVDELNGQYITAEDSGTSVEDMDCVYERTQHVVGHSHSEFRHHDPSPITAFGVRRSMEVAVRHKLKRESLSGIRVAIQGIGHVGYQLAKELSQCGALLTVSDINQTALVRAQDEFNATVVPAEQIHQVDCDVFAPCALGSAINSKNIEQIKAPIIAGCANNQLENPRMAHQLVDRGILYAPDYVINAGGLIQVEAQYHHKSEQAAKAKVENISNTLDEIFTLAEKERTSPLFIANRIAELRLKPR